MRRRWNLGSVFGIRRAVDRPWRFFIEGNPWVSRAPQNALSRSFSEPTRLRARAAGAERRAGAAARSPS